MTATGVIELIDKHAEGLTQAAFKDLLMNPRTPSFRGVPMVTPNRASRDSTNSRK